MKIDIPQSDIETFEKAVSERDAPMAAFVKRIAKAHADGRKPGEFAFAMSPRDARDIRAAVASSVGTVFASEPTEYAYEGLRGRLCSDPNYVGTLFGVQVFVDTSMDVGVRVIDAVV